MAIVAVAIVLSFHLRKTATELELRMAQPLGAVFWALSVSCLGVGLANYTSMDSTSFVILGQYMLNIPIDSLCFVRNRQQV